MPEKILRTDPNDETKTIEVPVYKAFESEEEFNKTIQSVSSKAKGEIMKELGITSIADFKEKLPGLAELDNLKGELAKKDTLITEKDTTLADIQGKYNELLKVNAENTEKLVLSKYEDKIPETFMKDFRTLTYAEVTEEKPLEVAAKEVFERLNITQVKNKIVIGGGAHQTDPIEEKEKMRNLTKL